jgi:glycosyltransferase involved in cell wall biosynthesis
MPAPSAAARVLFVASGEGGGAEYALATHLRHRPDGVEASALLLTPGLAETLLRDAGLPVTTASLESPITLRGAAGFGHLLFAEVRRVRPDVVHATGIRAALVCAPVCKALRVPLVWHKVDLAFDRRLAGPLSRLSAGVITVSEATAAAVPPRRLIGIVPPPVRLDESFVVSSPRPPATLGSIGRLVLHKGHHHVIRAAASLRPRFPEIRVLIAGAPVPYEAGQEERLRELAVRSGLDDRVELLGHVDRIETVLERLTVLVCATYREEREGSGHEGLPAAVIEASWAGLPVVATNGGGAPEALRDGVTGTLVPPAEPAALAAAVGRYLDDPEAAKATGRAGSAFAREHFRSEELSARLFAYLETTIARRRARRGIS